MFEKLQVALFAYLLLYSVSWIFEDKWLALSSKVSCWYIMIVTLSLVRKWSLLLSAVSWDVPHMFCLIQTAPKGRITCVKGAILESPCLYQSRHVTDLLAFNFFTFMQVLLLQADVNLRSSFLLLFNFYFLLAVFSLFFFFIITKCSVNKGEMGCVHGYD